MRVVICEDEIEHREFFELVIKNYSMFHEPSINLVLNAASPGEILEFLHNEKADCYFLDIELESQIDGMKLASIIRKSDPFANIIFISMHADRLKLTFKYKLAALDFIVKDDGREQIAKQIEEALQAAFSKYQQLGKSKKMKSLQIEVGNRVTNINYDDIYYLETSPQTHKIILHQVNGFYEFYGRLKEFSDIDERFFQCHKSYIVNIQHIKYIDREKREVKMANGKTCIVSFRKMRELQLKYLELG